MSAERTEQPRMDLASRYVEILRAAWAARAELQGPRRLADETAFLPAALSLQETPVHPAPRRAAYAIIALFLTALLWSVVGQVDIVAVAPGRVVVSERTKLVQPLQTSVVRRVLVRDGEQVQAGQPLVELDPTIATADKAAVQDARKAAESDLLRARAILDALGRHGAVPSIVAPGRWSPDETVAAQAQMAAEWSDIRAKLAKLGAETGRRQAEIATAQAAVAKLEATLPISRQREQDAERLAQQGFMATHAAQDRARERIEMQRDLETQRARLAETRAALQESESAREAYLAESRRTLHDREALAHLKRQHAVQEEAKVTHREKLTLLTASVAGTVQQLSVHTAGGVVTEAQTLMVIVPDGAKVAAEVAIENKDVGFVGVGQAAEIKLETFPYTRYGTVHGVVSRVTADAVSDERRGAIFPATLELASTQIDVDGKRIGLSPGMNLTAEIKTGKRRVIEYLLSPVQRARSESLRER